MHKSVLGRDMIDIFNMIAVVPKIIANRIQ